MKILAGEVQLDDGKLVFEKDIVVTRLEQDPPRHIEETVFDYVAEDCPSCRLIEAISPHFPANADRLQR